jgi:YfiH family protein
VLQRCESGGIRYVTDPAAADAGIITAFSERTGGVSPAPYATLNLGLQTDDDPAHVAENRRRLSAALGVNPRAHERLVGALQTHGTRIFDVTADALSTALAYPAHGVPDTDALMTQLPQTPLLLCFADCVPVILYATRPSATVAVVHSGWRGTLSQIAAVAVRAMQERYAVAPADITAVIGPAIGPESFEVDADLALKFQAVFPTIDYSKTRAETSDRPDFGNAPARVEKVRFDLTQAVRATLVQAGLREEGITALGISTVAESTRFFSYRADDGLTGRFGAYVCIA